MRTEAVLSRAMFAHIPTLDRYLGPRLLICPGLVANFAWEPIHDTGHLATKNGEASCLPVYVFGDACFAG